MNLEQISSLNSQATLELRHLLGVDVEEKDTIWAKRQ